MKKSDTDSHDLLIDAANELLSSLRVTLKDSTCRGYQSTLEDFYAFYRQRNKPLTQIQRSDVLLWLKELRSRNLAAVTRIHKIFQLRTYFRWLNERGQLRTDSDHLVRTSDLPSLPQYLPRPLPPDIDQELQKRLESSQQLTHQGLLLMRLTGLRIGELSRLEFTCLHRDFNGRSFIKVPLGKMNTERMVPLDERTICLIRAIQKKVPPKASNQLCISPQHFLFTDQKERPISKARFALALEELCYDFCVTEKITTHRLRHTYATSLLNAGMSLIGVMKLLGHNDYRMTLRYAALTQDTVQDEYHSVIAKVGKKYAIQEEGNPDETFDPVDSIDDIIRWLKSAEPKERLSPLMKRLVRIKSDLNLSPKT